MTKRIGLFDSEEHINIWLSQDQYGYIKEIADVFQSRGKIVVVYLYDDTFPK